jgi:hypothetical protein
VNPKLQTPSICAQDRSAVASASTFAAAFAMDDAPEQDEYIGTSVDDDDPVNPDQQESSLYIGIGAGGAAFIGLVASAFFLVKRRRQDIKSTVPLSTL